MSLDVNDVVEGPSYEELLAERDGLRAILSTIASATSAVKLSISVPSGLFALAKLVSGIEKPSALVQAALKVLSAPDVELVELRQKVSQVEAKARLWTTWGQIPHELADEILGVVVGPADDGWCHARGPEQQG